MATLNSLKNALGQAAAENPLSEKALSDEQYRAGFEILVQDSGWLTYQDFIIPELSRLLGSVFNPRARMSVLEIGPGPKSILGHLPSHLGCKIDNYTAFEPNILFAQQCEQWLNSADSSLKRLGRPPNIRRVPFDKDSRDDMKKYDLVLFCHSLYGIKNKQGVIEQTLKMVSENGMVVVFHRDGILSLEDLICYKSAVFPHGVVRIADQDDTLDRFAPFIAGFATQDNGTRAAWRNKCRTLGRCKGEQSGNLMFRSPNIMLAFTRHATALPKLTDEQPSNKERRRVKNREAILHHPASLVRPREILHVQQCVRWALKHRVGLTVVGGSHSGHCLWPGVVGVDMSAFDQVDIVTTEVDSNTESTDLLVVAGAGCNTGDIIRKTMAAGVTVPLGSRPSVGAGLWLQGGIGHLARLHGLACDAVVGAVIVGLEAWQVFCVGNVPTQHQPPNSIRPNNEADLLWALKGAGTNFGIVISVIFKTFTAPTYLVQNWFIRMNNAIESKIFLRMFNAAVASKLPQNCSADAYIYWERDGLFLGVTMVEAFTDQSLSMPSPASKIASSVLGLENDAKVVDSIGLFDTEMYMSGMHGGHGGGKTSSFKRCIFLRHIGESDVADRLMAAVASRPSTLCYLHLLHGGGAVRDLEPDMTAFGCRDWDFACVITGVWPRDQDGTEAARSAVEWVYSVAKDLLPRSCGAYGADLGPDPRDAFLAASAFGPNKPRLAQLKRQLDPGNVLAYACPLPSAQSGQKLIVLITGESGAGKDYTAGVWVSVLARNNITARAVSISDVTKREYATATGASLDLLLSDRAYKEQERPALTAFFQNQVRQRPQLPEEHFLSLVHDAAHVEVLLITDMRVIEVRVEASDASRRARLGRGDRNDIMNSGNSTDYHPNVDFRNDAAGSEAAEMFAYQHLLPLLHNDLRRLAEMVLTVPDFPRADIQFRHVLNISQCPGGLTLCTSLLQEHFVGSWSKVDVVASCEAGGFVFASALSARVDVPLVVIREAGKLPPPTISVIKPRSHISSGAPVDPDKNRIEMGRDAVPRGGSVVVVEDVLATGETLFAVLHLLNEACIDAEKISIMVVAEFPFHRGRKLLRQRGFGRVRIDSLLRFGGA